MVQVATGLRTLALAIWMGGGLAVLFGTRAIFGVAETRRQAGTFSGAVLASFVRVRVLAIALTVLGVALGAAGIASWLAVLALLLTLVGLPVDRALRTLRAQIGGSTEGLDPHDPRRKRWGALHGASVLLLLAQVICAAVGLVVAPR